MQVRNSGLVIWPELLFALQMRYQSRRSDFERRAEMKVRKQDHQEGIDEYFQAMLVLRSRLESPISDHEMIRMFVEATEALNKLFRPRSMLREIETKCNIGNQLQLREAAQELPTDKHGLISCNRGVLESLHISNMDEFSADQLW